MEITKAFIIVEIDHSGELRQIFITKENQEALITMVNIGMFHNGSITISDETIDTISIKDSKWT